MDGETARASARIDPQPDPPSKLPVIRVTVPARVAYDLDSMTKITKSMLKELGCAPCHSGFDIRFDIISQYTISKNMDVEPIIDVQP